jgi:hypothetical protein
MSTNTAMPLETGLLVLIVEKTGLIWLNHLRSSLAESEEVFAALAKNPAFSNLVRAAADKEELDSSGVVELHGRQVKLELQRMRTFEERHVINVLVTPG